MSRYRARSAEWANEGTSFAALTDRIRHLESALIAAEEECEVEHYTVEYVERLRTALEWVEGYAHCTPWPEVVRVTAEALYPVEGVDA